MSDPHSVGNHILVQCIDREPELFGEIGKGLSDGLDLGTCQVTITLGEFSVCLARLVVEL